MRNTVYKITILFFVSIFASCVKQIPFDINNKNKKVVIEGNLNNVDSIANVIISETVDLSATVPPPLISGAKVIITDVTNSKSVQLSEVQPGNYASKSIKGYPGHEYLLQVTIGDTKFEATSQMPITVKLDSIAFLDMSAFGLNNYHTMLYFQDPFLFENYYRYIQKVNGIEKSTINVLDDVFTNGNYQSVELYKTDLRKNDTVYVEMQCIDKAVFQYFNQISNVDQVSGQPNLAPQNPISNISGGAIGYFSAFCKQSRTAVVK